jgi:hypothetical protein
MPPVSKVQRAAMAAAAAGHSTLGIPKKVGAEFMASDKGGKLPEKVKGAAAKGSGKGVVYREKKKPERWG